MLIEITHEQAEPYNDYDDHCTTGDCTLIHKEVTLKELLDKTPDYQLQQWGLVRLEMNKDKPVTAATAKIMRDLGWSRVDVAKDREEKKVLEEEYYILDEHGGPYSLSYNPKFGKIDLDEIKDVTLDQLANGARIVQKVSARSVLKESDYKKYLTKKKQKEDAIERAKKSKETKEKNKKQREIEKARKILEEAGELK